MSPLMTILANSSASVWETTALVGAVIVAIGVRSTEPSRKPAQTSSVDRHTMHDIGVEPGSITWMR
ncbi:MAG: hypothetical protein ACR2PA_25645 [Hyphomicrobiaceae bacterium]